MYPNELLVGSDTLDLKVRDVLEGAPLVCFDPGRAYVVEFWPAWKGPYRSSIPNLDALRAMHPELPFVTVAVHEADRVRVKAFVRRESEALASRKAGGNGPADGGGDGGPRGALRHDAHEIDVSVAFIVDRAGRIAWIGPPATIDEPLRRILESGDDRAPAGTSMEAVGALEVAVLERLAACDSEGALRLIAEGFAETPSLRTAFFAAKASDLLFASLHTSSLHHDDANAVATQNARMLIAAADMFTTAVEIDNAKPIPEITDDIAHLAVAMLMKAEALAGCADEPLLLIMISRALARLLLAIDLPEHALERAKMARQMAERSFGDLVRLNGLDTLVTRCEARLC